MPTEQASKNILEWRDCFLACIKMATAIPSWKPVKHQRQFHNKDFHSFSWSTPDSEDCPFRSDIHIWTLSNKYFCFEPNKRLLMFRCFCISSAILNHRHVRPYNYILTFCYFSFSPCWKEVHPYKWVDLTIKPNQIKSNVVHFQGVCRSWRSLPTSGQRHEGEWLDGCLHL